jgi:nitrile hydratase accessory protein
VSDESARLDAEGPAAPPRLNGELVFEAPWEGRVFGLTMALCDRGAFAWEDFRRHLIAEIGAWERDHPEPVERQAAYRYYERWQAALERLLAERGLCPPGELTARTRELAARPAGHDHGD